MRETIFKCGAVGAVILFVWGWLTWTVLPLHTSQFRKFDNESSVQDAILRNAPVSGIYTIPSCCNMEKKMDKGPFIYMSVMKEDKSYNIVGCIIKGLILKFIGACLVTWLLLQTKLNFKNSVVFISVIGFLIAFMSTMPHKIWFHFPTMYVVAAVIESVVGWFLAGLAIAKLAKR